VPPLDELLEEPLEELVEELPEELLVELLGAPLGVLPPLLQPLRVASTAASRRPERESRWAETLIICKTPCNSAKLAGSSTKLSVYFVRITDVSMLPVRPVSCR
jgi:hypothetical protein